MPAGGAENNAVVREWGKPRKAEGIKPHWEIGTRLGLIDFERGAKISGSGFIVFRAGGAKLVRSLMSFMLDLHTTEHGYEEVWVPAVVNRASMIGTAQLPKFEDDMYRLSDEDMFLIPTAEVPVTNLYRDEILNASELPKAFTAYSPCFRREAGAAGKDTRGLLRVHEFDKVELVRYATPESSDDELELLTGHAEKALQLLDLPTAWCGSRRATPALRARIPTISKCSRRESGSGSRFRPAATSPTSRRAAPTFGTSQPTAASRASFTR